MLKINLEKATFVKNDDDTYTIYQRIGSGILKLPKCHIELKAEALADDSGEIFQWIECGSDALEDTSKTTILLRKIKRFFGIRR